MEKRHLYHIQKRVEYTPERKEEYCVFDFEGNLRFRDNTLELLAGCIVRNHLRPSCLNGYNDPVDRDVYFSFQRVPTGIDFLLRRPSTASWGKRDSEMEDYQELSENEQSALKGLIRKYLQKYSASDSSAGTPAESNDADLTDADAKKTLVD